MSKVVVIIQGGVIQDVISDESIDVIIVDMDNMTEEVNENELIEVNNDKLYIYESPICVGEIEPTQVSEIHLKINND